jgi:hypothetical protein
MAITNTTDRQKASLSSNGQEESKKALFDNCFTQQFGMPSTRVQMKIKDYLSEDIKAFIARSPFLVMATADTTGSCDASPKGGKPGFVTILDDRHLLIPDVAGNKLFQSYLNIVQNPGVGLIFFIPGVDGTVRVNGRAIIVSKEELTRRRIELSLHNPDTNAIALQGLVIAVEEAYTHCPRALKFSDLWNVETIQKNQKK